MKRAIGAGCAALAAAAVVTGADAASLRCARPAEVTAIQAAAIQQDLMVAALTCHDTAAFNSFQTSFNRELRASDATLLGMFHRLYGFRRGETEYHAFKTRLANDSSIRSIHNNPDYCQEASQAFSAALASAKPTLVQFVSSVQVSDASPVDSCEIRVATGLKGAGVPAVVPEPNPVRVAQVSPGPDDSQPESPPDVQPAGQDQAPPDASAPQPADASGPPAPEAGVLPPEGTSADPSQQPAPSADTAATQQPPPKKNSDGWLSGLTDWF
jgi:hypothetical protein